MTRIFIYRENCKSSEEMKGILDVKDGHGFKMICLDNYNPQKVEDVLYKYGIREIPCVVTDSDDILSGSQMFLLMKQSSTGNTVSGNDGMNFSQQFAGRLGGDDEINQSNMFGTVENMGSSIIEEKTGAKNKKKGKQSDIDRRYNSLIDKRSKEMEKHTGNSSNARPDFTRPIYPI